MEDIVKDLRLQFLRYKFFVRVHEKDGKIIIWNDRKIKIELDAEKIADIGEHWPLFVQGVIKIFHEKIKKYYDKMEKRMVSVIIPNYNNEMFLLKTIDSILNQDYPDIEVILVDDASTDQSVKLIEGKYGEDSRVRIFRNTENKGAYYCRNRGLLISRGYYVTFVDGDDFIEKEKIGYEVSRLEKKKDCWGYGTRFRRLYIKDSIDNVVKVNESNSYVYLFRRELFNRLGYYQNNRFGADSELIMRGRYWGYKFFRDEEKIFYNAYTVSGKNLTHIYRGKERQDYIEEREEALKNEEYIEMALLEDKNWF